jgi:C1A family cysteine protease
MNTLYRKTVVIDFQQEVGTGWLPPRPDLRDYTTENLEIKPILKKLNIKSLKAAIASSIDLREFCSQVENQGTLGSCTANAGVGIIEYFEKRAFNNHIEASRLFLYKTTRNLMQSQGDTGEWLRYTMGALVLCGVPSEKYWPYDITKFDVEPDAFLYSIANNYQPVKYFCHDPLGYKIPFPEVLDSVKKYLTAGIPSMFGFWGFASFDKSDIKGAIPYPAEGESAQWGHAVVAVGYDDNKSIVNLTNNKSTKGALLIRNSWGKEWGDRGYGWLPYDYVLNNLALDFWSLISMQWIDSKEFGF